MSDDNSAGSLTGQMGDSQGLSGKASNRLVRGKVPFKSAFIGLAVLAIILVVAIIMAANNESVLGWILAIICGGWLILGVVALMLMVKAASFAGNKLNEVQSMVQDQQDLMKQRNLQANSNNGGTTLVADYASADPIRDEKLAHSFKIIEVQAGIAAENAETDTKRLGHALETIVATAQNGYEMLEE